MSLNRTTMVRLLAAWTMVALAACGGESTQVGANGGAGADASGQDALSGPVTWYQHVRPLLARACFGCHRTGGIAAFGLDDIETARAMGTLMVSAVEQGRMPPWGAQDTAECTPPLPWKHDLRLSAGDRTTLSAWVAAGGPEGDAASATPIPTDNEEKLDEVDRDLAPENAFVTSGNQDQFICFVLDPKFTEDAWVRGVNFRAGDARVAHHGLLFVDASGASVQKAGDKGYYPCFGGPGINGQLIAAWAPGGVPAVLPDDAGLPVPKGARLVLQMHYHPLGESIPDATHVEFDLLDKRPSWTAVSMLIGNFHKPLGGGDGLQAGPDDVAGPEFRIPAGATDHPESMVWTVPKFNGVAIGGLRVYGVASHMHYVGKDMRIWLERGEVQGLCSSETREALGGCADTQCGGKAGQDLVTCAVEKCGAQVSAAGAACQQCLVAASAAGADAMWAVCAPQTRAADQQDACLLHTPAWDFNWQRYYFYDAPTDALPSVRTGDKLHMRCVYDNSKGNPGVARALAEQGKDAPSDVVLGDETLDEMCLAALYLLYPTTPEK